MDKIVTYYEHEDTKIRLERSNKRLFILCLVMLLSLVGSNAYWVYTESQYEDVSTTYSQESEVETNGGTAIVNNGGDMNYGTNKGATDSNN